MLNYVGNTCQWLTYVARLTSNRPVESHRMVPLFLLARNFILVLVGSRNGFELNFTIELK